MPGLETLGLLTEFLTRLPSNPGGGGGGVTNGCCVPRSDTDEGRLGTVQGFVASLLSGSYSSTLSVHKAETENAI